MVSIDVLIALNEYYSVLRKTCGTLGRNELNRLCLLPLLQDIVDGPLTPYLTDTDEAYIDTFIKECFSSMISEGTTPYVKIQFMYSGTSNSYPSNNVILNASTKYSSSETQFTSPKASGKYFWIAIPKGFSLENVENKNFAGDVVRDYMFTKFETTIESVDYDVYYLKSTIPLKSIYTVTINRN